MEHGARSVLLIDDEAVNRLALARQLALLGVREVVEAEDGRAGLAACADAAFDAVICDIDMHPMDGIDFLRALRARTTIDGRRTPVIILSKYSAGAVVRSAREFGANAYLVKPVSREAVLETLTRVVPAPPAEPSSATVPLEESGSEEGRGDGTAR